MFDWLIQEMALIKTPRFHIVEDSDPARIERARQVVRSSLPADYEGFIATFGNARLYRRAKNASYYVGVFAEPRELPPSNFGVIYEIGFNYGAIVAAKFPSGSSDVGCILEAEGSSFRVVANSFDEWLQESCSKTRRAFGTEKWNEIVLGAPPFSPEELAVIFARRLFRWERLTTDPEGNVGIKVWNGSNHILKSLTIGVRSLDGRMNGAIRVPVKKLQPGESAIFAVNCYKELVMPHEIELFALPDPQPEDRERFPELQDAGNWSQNSEQNL
jgi:hypothetical protein